MRKKLKHVTQSPVLQLPDTGMKCKFINLPVDVLLEVFVYLHPLDLVHICRVSAGLRSLLAQPSTQFIWRESYKNVPRQFNIPPPCPPGQNITAYTAFLYCSTCNLCGADLKQSYSTTRHPGPMLTTCCYESSQCVLTKEIFKEFDHQIWSGGADPVYSLCSWFPPPDTPYSSAQCMIGEYESISRSLSACSSPEETASKIEQYRRERQQSSEHFEALDEFFRQEYGTQNFYSDIMQNQGWKSISNLIQREGYVITKDLSLSRVIKWMELGYFSGQRWAPNLTVDQVWENVRLKVVWEMENETLEKLEQELMDVLTRRVDTFTVILRKTLDASRNREIEPTSMDFLTNSPFQEVILDVAQSDPADATFEEQVQSLMTHVPGFIREWRKRSEDLLVNLISTASSVEENHSPDILYLAKSFFECHWCHEPLSFPRVLAHKCVRTRYISKGEEHHVANITKDDEEAMIRTISNRQLLLDFLWRNLAEWNESARSWNTYGDQVLFHIQASICATRVIKAMGHNPDVVTSAFMDAQEERVECLTCTQSAKVKTRKRLIMTWRAAITHNQEKHTEEGCALSVWGKVSREDTKVAKESESTNTMAARWRPGVYTCKHCNEDVVRNSLSGHLLDRHDIKWKERKSGPRKRDFTVSIDIRMKRPPYVVRI